MLEKDTDFIKIESDSDKEIEVKDEDNLSINNEEDKNLSETEIPQPLPEPLPLPDWNRSNISTLSSRNTNSIDQRERNKEIQDYLNFILKPLESKKMLKRKRFYSEQSEESFMMREHHSINKLPYSNSNSRISNNGLPETPQFGNSVKSHSTFNNKKKNKVEIKVEIDNREIQTNNILPEHLAGQNRTRSGKVFQAEQYPLYDKKKGQLTSFEYTTLNLLANHSEKVIDNNKSLIENKFRRVFGLMNKLVNKTLPKKNNTEN